MKLVREILFPLIAVVAAFVIGGIVVWIIGDSPWQTYKLLIGSAFSWPDGIGYTLFNATPLIFTGLAVAVAFRRTALRGGLRSRLGGVQVWRRRSGQHGNNSVHALAGISARAALLHRRHCRGRSLGRDSGSTQSEVRIT